jgi:hypothetical protein
MKPPLRSRQRRWNTRPGAISIACAGVALVLLGIGAPRAQAQFTIVPTFDSSITVNDPANAAAIEATINQAIAVYESVITTPITVNITYAEMGGGLGESETPLYGFGYQTVAQALLAKYAANPTDPSDVSAAASVPNQATDPMTGGSTMWISQAEARALGFGVATSSDGEVFLNTSIMNLNSSQTNPNHYSLLAVVEHETDEVLGTGSGLNLSGSPFNLAPRPEDLFRYSASGTRSYSTSAATSYFSVNQGATNLVSFNQNGSGDYGDWLVNSPAQVQDWEGTPGTTPTLGPNELAALDVVGYDVQNAPEPGALVMLGAIGLGASAYYGLRHWRERRSALAAPTEAETSLGAD